MTDIDRLVWVCTCCSTAYLPVCHWTSEGEASSWRYIGSAYEHNCPKNHPQAGTFDAVPRTFAEYTTHMRVEGFHAGLAAVSKFFESVAQRLSERRAHMAANCPDFPEDIRQTLAEGLSATEAEAQDYARRVLALPVPAAIDGGASVAYQTRLHEVVRGWVQRVRTSRHETERLRAELQAVYKILREGGIPPIPPE